MEKTLGEAIRLALEAAETATPAPDSKTWDYGWCIESYRRSGHASITSPNGPIMLSIEGIQAFEHLVTILQKQPIIKDRWDSEDFWGVMASLVAFISTVENRPEVAKRNLEMILSRRPAVVAFPVANIDWQGPPRRFGGGFLIGILGGEFSEKLATMGEAARDSAGKVSEYVNEQSHRPPLVGFAAVVPAQGQQAFHHAKRAFELLVDLAILLDRKKIENSLFSIRGGSNRPGVRGLALDRTVINASMKASGDSADLACRPFIQDARGTLKSAYWHSADRVPLEKMLSNNELAGAVDKCLAGKSNITRRVQVAARWFSESFWAESEDDSVLAAGVALDSLVGSRSGLPGRAMKERYAFLEEEPGKRSDKAREWDEIYSARSAIAHGGESQKVKEPGFARRAQGIVTWTAWRLLEAERHFLLEDKNKSLDSLFEEMRWGTCDWDS
jgi:hypothetical protein